MKVAIIVSSIILFVILLFFVVLFVLYRMAFYNNYKHTNKDMLPLKGERYEKYQEKSLALIASSNAIPYEIKELKIGRKFTLRAKYYFKHKDAPLAIMVHGYKGCGIRDFSGGLQELLKRESNVLVIDHRGHGISDGRTITFGVKEKYDVLKWIEWANKEFNNPDIYLYGISMGAATVLMVSGMDLPSNVKCVIADCPYASIKGELKYTIKKMHLSPTFAYPFLYLAALVFAHFDINKGEVKNYLKNTKLPIMLVHGNYDDTVPVENSRFLKETFPEKILYIEVDNAPHGLSYFEDYDRYSNTLTEFLNSIK